MRIVLIVYCKLRSTQFDNVHLANLDIFSFSFLVYTELEHQMDFILYLFSNESMFCCFEHCFSKFIQVENDSRLEITNL